MAFNNPMQMIQQFNQFRQTFQGNPKQEVERLMASGKISQSQLNQLQTLAGEFQKLMQNFNK